MAADITLPTSKGAKMDSGSTNDEQVAPSEAFRAVEAVIVVYEWKGQLQECQPKRHTVQHRETVKTLTRHRGVSREWRNLTVVQPRRRKQLVEAGRTAHVFDSPLEPRCEQLFVEEASARFSDIYDE
eukprot:RCo033550